MTRMVDRRRIHNGNYTPDEYHRLTPAQREAVRDMRRQAHRDQNNNRRNDSNRTNRNHNVSSVARTLESDDAPPEDNNNNSHSPSTDRMTRFAPAGNVGGYLANRRYNQTQRDNVTSA